MNNPLVACRDCGQPISQRARACPHCGGPTGPGWVVIMAGVVLTIFAGVMLLGALLALFTKS